MKIFSNSELMMNNLNFNGTDEFLSSIIQFNILSSELKMHNREVYLAKSDFDRQNTFMSFKAKQENYEKI